jgi:uncharacterized membrane protein
VNTTSFTSSLTTSLLGDLQLGVQLGPLGLPIPGIGALVASIISGATGSIDTLLNSVLQTLGVGLGRRMSGSPASAATGNPVLVN